jgi:hypothetical protein
MANDSNSFDDSGRDRGIFTERDRRFLAGELDEELSDNERRQKRYRLRKRMFHALQDLMYLEFFSNEDIGQLAAQFSYAAGNDRYSLPPNAKPLSEDMLVNARLYTAIEETTAFWYELYPEELFITHLERVLHVGRVLDYYEETGRFPLVDTTIDVEYTGEDLSIGELMSIVWGQEPLEKEGLDMDALRGAWEVLDLHDINGVPSLPGEYTDDEYQPKHPELGKKVREEIKDAGRLQDNVVYHAPIYEVVDTVAEQEGGDFDMAHEAFLDAFGEGDVYTSSPGFANLKVSDSE